MAQDGFRWPEPYKAAAVLTFDIDGVVGFEGSAVGSLDNRPSVRSLAEYEPDVAVPRILDWLGELGLSATFFVPGRMAELHPGMVRRIVAAGQEVAHHGYLHLKPDRIDATKELEEIERALPVLEDLVGGPVRGSRTPGWAPSARTLRLLKEHGFLYDSSLMGHDVPYVTAEGLLELPCLWALDDWEQWGYLPFPGWEYPMNDPVGVGNLWTEHFDGLADVGGVFVLTLHPWISGRPAYTRVVRRLVEQWQAAHPEVWWASCADVYRHAAATGQTV